MAKEQYKFYRCDVCGNIVGIVDYQGGTLVCCGKEMTPLIPNTVDASGEKHVPVIEVDGNKVTVKVGSVPHPMVEEHYIMWVYVETLKGGQRKMLKPNDEPVATFCLTDDDELISAYEYCNLHGLWKADYNKE